MNIDTQRKCDSGRQCNLLGPAEHQAARLPDQQALNNHSYDRRRFLTHAARLLSAATFGVGNIALASMLQRDAIAQDGWTPPDRRPHFVPKAKM